MPLIDHALAAAKLVLRVFPLRPLSTVPAIDSWMEDATTDAGKISAWWQETPNANVGIPTGSVNDLFVVDLDGAEAQAWWRSQGFADGARVDVPTGPNRTQIYFRLDGLKIESSNPGVGVTIHGEGGFVLAPPSILATGTFRGDLSGIPVADFDPGADLSPTIRQRMLPMLDVANLLPEFTSTGEPFTDLLFWAPLNETAEEFRAARSRLFHEALNAQLTRHQAASVAWGSRAGSELRERFDGLERMWREVDEAEAAGRTAGNNTSRSAGPKRITLLTDQERAGASVSAWWGSRYADWAEGVVPGAGSYHRLYRWLVLSQAFTDYGIVPKRNNHLKLELPLAAIGTHSSGIVAAREPTSAVLRALGVSDVMFKDLAELRRSGDHAHFESKSADAALAAWDWTPDRLAQFVWAIDPTGYDSVESLAEDQHMNVPISRLDPIPARLAVQLADAREQLTLALGKPPFQILMEQDALDRHSALKLALREMLKDKSVALFDFADSIRKCATLVAMSEGAPTVKLEHELIAIEQAEEWLGNLVWMMAQNESSGRNQTARPSNRSRINGPASYATER
jgi:hypothetical protein